MSLCTIPLLETSDYDTLLLDISPPAPSLELGRHSSTTAMLQYFSMYESSIPKRKTTDSEPRKDMEGSPPIYPRLEPGDVFAGSPSPSTDTTGHETPDNQGISNLAAAAADRQGQGCT